MPSLILPRSLRTTQPSNARASDLALSNGCGALLLPTDTGWSDSLNMLSVTGAVGSPATVANASGVARSYSATADFFRDLGLLDPTAGYAWIMHGALVSSGGNWGGLIARTRDNTTIAGWGWQKDNSGNLRVYHGGGSNYNFGSIAPLIDGLPHTFLGLWRSDTNEVELWRDGALFWSGSLSTVPDYWAGQGQIKLFSSRDTATFVGTCSMAGLFTGNMDQGTASNLSANPWQLFSNKRVLYFDFGGGGVTGTLSVTLENFTSSINGTTTIVGTIAQTMAAFTSAITGTSEVPGTIAATTEAAVGALEGTVGTDGPTGTITGLVEDSMASMAGSTSIVGTMNVTLEENTSSITGTTTVVGQMAASVADFVSSIYGTSGLQTATNRLLALIGVGK